MKRNNVKKLMCVLALTATASAYACKFVITNDSKKEVMVVAPYRFINRSITLQSGKKGSINPAGVITKLGAAKETLRFYENGKAKYQLTEQFCSDKGNTFNYSKVKGWVKGGKSQKNTVTGKTEKRFVVTDLEQLAQDKAKKSAATKQAKKSVKKNGKKAKKANGKKMHGPCGSHKNHAHKMTRREKMYGNGKAKSNGSRYL